MLVEVGDCCGWYGWFYIKYVYFQVTGGNKGIGYGIVKGLCEKYNGTVYLTARDVGRGEQAVGELKKVSTWELAIALWWKEFMWKIQWYWQGRASSSRTKEGEYRK